MCGISAWFRLEASGQRKEHDFKTQYTLESTMNRSLNMLRHRGPDADGTWLNDYLNVCLGSVRLAIKDLTPTANQPLHDDHSDIHAVVNGEIYSYNELRSQLESTHSFKSCSDSELVIAAYKHYGISFLNHLRGEFALCIYDQKRKLFIAARDRFGVKPLYWTRIGDQIHFASEAKAFLPFGWQPQWDVRSIVEDGWLHDERTLFSGVKKIRAGHYMTCISFEHIEQHQYWDLDYPDKNLSETRTEDEMTEGLRGHLVEAVSERLQGDVPMGLYLSGGIDSAAIAGIVKDIYNRRNTSSGERQSMSLPPCFCVGFDSKTEFDEMPIAQRTAEYLGLPFFSRRLDESSLAELFEDATYHSEVHNPDLNTIAKFALSKLVGDHGVKVVLSGEGSDELFGGYPNFLPDYVREPDLSYGVNELDDVDRQHLTEDFESKALPGFKGIPKSFVQNRSDVARRATNGLAITSCLWTVTLAHFAAWTKNIGCVSVEETRAKNPSADALERINHKWHPLHSAQYIWARSILSNWILTCMGDRMEMGHSIEGRPPFLDHHLANYANALPPSIKVKYDPETGQTTEKWVLREAVRPFITDELYRRRKHAFSAPYAYKTGGSMHSLLSRLITRKNLEQLGFVDVDMSLKMLEEAFSTRNPAAIRFCFIAAQWVTLSQRLGIAPARPPNVARSKSVNFQCLLNDSWRDVYGLANGSGHLQKPNPSKCKAERSRLGQWNIRDAVDRFIIVKRKNHCHG